jgi:hypothetical protein
VLEPFVDVVIIEGRAAHTGSVGEEVQEILLEYWIPMIQLAARMSHLNSVKHSWRRGKAWPRTFIRDNNIKKGNMASAILCAGLNRITHIDIAKDMVMMVMGLNKKPSN